MLTYTQKVFGRQTAGVKRKECCFEIRKQEGFTLLELMVVVAIMAVLAGLLLPAVNRSKSRAQALMCMNNLHHLAFTWTMYSGDNNSRLAYNQGPNTQSRMFSSQSSPATPNWVNNVMDWELTPGNTNLDFVNQSVLAPYASYSTSIFRCPADRALSPIQRKAGWAERVRSISMNAMVGDPGSLMQGGIKTDNPGYDQFLRDSDFRDPSSIFVFLDEHPDSIDDGYFLNTAGSREWVDLPASSHNGGSSFSYADGHTDIHRWQNKTTIRPPSPEAAALPLSLSADETQDFDWVIHHTSTPSR